MTEEEKIIKDQFNSLPDNLKKALDSVPWRSFIKQIGLENKLMLDQIDRLERETMLILYAFDDPKNYIDNLVKEVELSKEQAAIISDAVAEKIIVPIEERAESLEKTSKEPIIITQETKQQALEELKKRREAATGSITAKDLSEKPANASTPTVPEVIPPSNLPMVEDGEKVHDAPKTLEVKIDDEKVPEKSPIYPEAPVEAPEQKPAPSIKAEEPVRPAQPVQTSKAKPASDIHPDDKVIPTATKPINPKYPGGVDPYREPLD